MRAENAHFAGTFPTPIKEIVSNQSRNGKACLRGKKKRTFEALDSQTQARFESPYERPTFCQKAVALAKMLVSIRSC